MNLRALISSIACVFAACSDPAVTPDASVPNADASANVDAPGPDANPTCPAGQLCLQITPIDAVTALPPGRLAVAWQGQAGEIEVAYDVAWPAAPVTVIDLTQITPPTAPFQTTAPSPCTGVQFAAAVTVVSTDPDGSGSITATEIQQGINDGTIYGVHQ
jgi:hypothetical protein